MESLIIIASLIGFILLLVVVYFLLHLIYKSKKANNLIQTKESSRSNFYLDSFAIVEEIINSNDCELLKKEKLNNYKKSHYYIFNLYLIEFNFIIVDLVEKLLKSNSDFWKVKHIKEIVTLENKISFLKNEINNK